MCRAIKTEYFHEYFTACAADAPPARRAEGEKAETKVTATALAKGDGHVSIAGVSVGVARRERSND
jgi:hypothetical protein